MTVVAGVSDDVQNRPMGTADPIASTPEERIDVAASFPAIRATVAICGAASNAGKTWLCESVIRGLAALSVRTCALKVTRTHLGDCPRGIATCGTCDSVAGDFELVVERDRLDVPRKDTGRYFAAGADDVLWLLVKPAAMRKGIVAALGRVPAGAVLVAEGNSFRDFASSDVSLLALANDGVLKPSALHVRDRVDACVRPWRATTKPAAQGGARAPLLDAADAWPFVRDRLGARIPS